MRIGCGTTVVQCWHNYLKGEAHCIKPDALHKNLNLFWKWEKCLFRTQQK
uniref:Uncharacterized protein n=1 Tax=Anguilla anguilla TaxID=7936 RepID=A0A0E9P8S0_ANGAN